MALSPALPRILSGSAGAVAMTNIAQFGIRGGKASDELASSFESMYAEAVAGTLGGTAKESFEAAHVLQKSAVATLPADNGAVYPQNPLGNSLRQIAQLIKSGVGLEIGFTDVGGWDTHAGEGGAQGQLANNLRNFSDAIAAFAKDLGSRMGDVVLVTMSEFGRTVHENGNRGTDHGHANVMLVLGGGVKGGKGLWHMAGPRAAAAVRKPRCRRDDRLPRCLRRVDHEATRRSGAQDGLSGIRGDPVQMARRDGLMASHRVSGGGVRAETYRRGDRARRSLFQGSG